MKLLNINMARAIWLFPFRDLNPNGQWIGQEGLNAIAERYRFQIVPTVADTIEANRKNEPVVFGTGVVTSKEGTKVAADLKIFTDGLLVETRSSTHDCELLLRDLLEWAPSALKLPKVKISIKKKLFVSEIYVSCEKELTVINSKLSKFVKTLAGAMQADAPKSYQLVSMMFATDPKDGTQLANFKIERQINANFADYRYFSAAPMHTDVHLDLIAQFESLLQ